MNDKLKTVIREFLSSDKGSPVIGNKYENQFLEKRQDYINTLIKKNKRKLVKRYKKNAEQVVVGRAVNSAKKYIENMKQQDIKEFVRKSLMEKPETINSKQFIHEREEEENPQDKITMDVPLFIRMLEYAREDASTDIDLHDIAEKAIGLSSEDKVLTMADYEFIVGGTESLDEDLDLGHQDNEPHMIKGELYRIGKYAIELYKMVDSFEGKGEVDFPAWWQSKVTTSMNNMVSAKHYLDFELKEPAIDAMVNIASDEEVIDEKKSKKLPKDYDKDGKIESSEEEYKGVKDRAIKKAKGLAEIIAKKLMNND
jgi:hypothetical protein